MMDLFSTKIAYAVETPMTLEKFIGNVNEMIINPLIVFLFALALVYFLYGVFEFLSNQQNEEKKTTGKQHMIWGIVGITIMMGVFTIMSIILSTLGVPKEDINLDKGDVKLHDIKSP